MNEIPKVKKRKHVLRTVLYVLLGLVLLAGAAFGGYWYREQQAVSNENELSATIDQLRERVTELEGPVDTDDSSDVDSATCAAVRPNAAAIENIQAAITTGNTQPLEGHMASSVMVLYAASDGVGERTRTQAVSDITSFIGGSTVSWAFNIPDSTLKSYRNGFYKQYFPETALVGKSSEDRVLSFNFDCDGDIATVFMSMSESELQ